MTTTMPSPIREILDWQQANAGKIFYSQTGPDRLNPDALLGATDCSGELAKLFKHFANGLNIGTYTGNECFSGHLVSTNKSDIARGAGLLPGDLIFFEWSYENSGTWDHVAMYAGDGQIWNHGGVPEYGPVLWNLASNVASARKVMARRMIPWVSTPSAPPHFPLKGRATFHKGIPQGPTITLIQQRLTALGYLAPGNTGGNYLDLTTAAVKAFQRRQRGLLFPTGKVGAKTWGRLFATNAPANKKKV